jgi:hypothetical protein
MASLLLAGTAAEGENINDVNFAVLPDFIRNGEFEFNANGSYSHPKCLL